MRAFDRNFARAARIFDPNFMRGGRKPAHPSDKILNGERVLRDDEILSGGGILSDRIWIDNKILKGGGILSGSGILNLTSRGRTRRGFSRRILRELCGEASLLHLLRKFQSVSGSQADYKFKRATALQTDREFKRAVVLQTGRKFKKAASLRTACKFKASMQKFHRGSCAAVELLRQKSRGETVLRNRIKFQSSPYVLARLNFQGAMSEMGAGGLSVPLKFQISVAALSQLKFEGVLNAITRLKFQGAVATVAEFARSKFKGLPQAAQCHKIRAQGQGG
nr:hypothetical protein [uncultured Campylobacter sp.]